MALTHQIHSALEGGNIPFPRFFNGPVKTFCCSIVIKFPGDNFDLVSLFIEAKEANLERTESVFATRINSENPTDPNLFYGNG